MAATPSTMKQLGSNLPVFTLPDTVTGTLVSSENFANRPLLVMFICNHCPFVVHVRDELARLGRDYQPKGLGIVAINSNDIENYPDDRPEKMKEVAQRSGFVFPYLFDETQQVAKAFDAACTPDFFLYDASHSLVYRGQLDASRPGNDVPVTGEDLRKAIDAVLVGSPVGHDQKPSIGCNIKWKDVP